VTRLAAFLVDARTSRGAAQAVQIAAAGRVEQKVELALALGREFARGWGLKTLVIDLDGAGFEALGGGQSHKAPTILAGVELNLFQTSELDLWALSQAAGEESPLTGARLPLDQAETILNSLREQFARIVVIAPADYESYGARRLNALVDAHLILVRAERSKAPVLRHLKEVILASGGDLLGFIYTHRRFYIPEQVYKWL
jgi:hypothetical protein